MTSELCLIEAPPGVIARFSTLCERTGMRFRVMPVQGGPSSAQGDDEADDATVTPLLLRLERTAEALDCSPTTVKRLVRCGDLPAVKVGGSTRIRVEDLRAFVEQLAQPTTQAAE